MKLFNVVIVDDDKSLVYGIKEQLNHSQHFKVVGYAHDGVEGIDLINELKPDIVILDMIMPGLDGLALLEHFKGQNFQFLVLSAIGHDLVTRRAVSLGAIYYMVKPFDFKELLNRLNGLFLGEETIIKEKQKMINYDYFIMNELNYLSVPMHIKGFHYIKESLKIILATDETNLKITKVIYPQVASVFNTTASSVERAIRNAVEVTYNRNMDLISDYFKHELFNHKITNKEFLIRIASRIKKQL